MRFQNWMRRTSGDRLDECILFLELGLRFDIVCPQIMRYKISKPIQASNRIPNPSRFVGV